MCTYHIFLGEKRERVREKESDRLFPATRMAFFGDGKEEKNVEKERDNLAANSPALETK